MYLLNHTIHNAIHTVNHNEKILIMAKVQNVIIQQQIYKKPGKSVKILFELIA